VHVEEVFTCVVVLEGPSARILSRTRRRPAESFDLRSAGRSESVPHVPDVVPEEMVIPHFSAGHGCDNRAG
jgi:hypothetical protein